MLGHWSYVFKKFVLHVKGHFLFFLDFLEPLTMEIYSLGSSTLKIGNYITNNELRTIFFSQHL